ncbi:LOW QUALITY PROTEIN: hypothetical protein U0070_021544, partial [Myodes glareolus]
TTCSSLNSSLHLDTALKEASTDYLKNTPCREKCGDSGEEICLGAGETGPIQIQGGLAEFQKMVELKTGYFSGLVYLTYACHCGLGGSGYPADETDWCCFYHDCCYDRLEIRDCGTLLGLPYHFTKQGNEIICSSNQDPCQRQLCQCDKVAADCFARNLQTFKFPYIFYSNERCRGKTPSCSFLHSLVV